MFWITVISKLLFLLESHLAPEAVDCPIKQSGCQAKFCSRSKLSEPARTPRIYHAKLPRGVNEVDDEGGNGKDEYEADQDPSGARLARDQLPCPVLGLGHEVILLGPRLPAPLRQTQSVMTIQ